MHVFSAATPPVDRWGIRGEARPLAGGHRNRVVRVGDHVFKSTRRTAEALAWLAPLQACARDAGFIVPTPLASKNERLIEDGWTCERHVEGRAATAETLPVLNPFLQRFHAASAALPQRPGFRSSVELVTDIRGGDVDLTAMPATLVAQCRAAWDAVAACAMAGIHGDLGPGNVLWAPDGRPALIDWDESRRDLVLFDTCAVAAGDKASMRARLAWEIACSWRAEPAHARALAQRF